MTNIVDDLIRGSDKAAGDELKHMLERVNYSDLTPAEKVAWVVLVRPIYERVRDGVQPVSLEVVRNRKPPGRV